MHTWRGVLFWLVVMPLVLPGTLKAQTEESTRAITDRYLDLTFSQQYDALLDVYAPDAVFTDPTSDVFQGPVSQGAVRGAEAIVAMQKGWGLAQATFKQRASFTVGEYSLYRGTLTTRYNGSDIQTPIPFVTVLQAANGRIVARTDFGEYIESFGLGDQFDTNTETTRDIAWRYLRAYLDGDLETQTTLAAENIRFQDPTAKVYGPSSGLLYRGREILMNRRTQIYRNLTDFDLEVAESFVANHHAVYMGTTTYTLRNGERYAQPAVFVVEVRDGRVTRHWDFVDYSVGPS